VSNTLIVLLGIAAIALGLMIGRVRGKPDPAVARWPLYARQLLNEREQVMYHRLQQTFGDHVVLAQVAFSQLLGIESNTKDRQAIGNRFRQLTADFVLCDRAFRPIAVIELDGLSHDEPRRQAADQRKEHAVRSAGLKLLRINVASIPDGAQLHALLSDLKVEPRPAAPRTSRGSAHVR
jgi:very-short-patch-repair endonuclease